MWKPRRLTTLWAFTACYRDSFTFYLFTHLEHRSSVKSLVSLQFLNLRQSVGLLVARPLRTHKHRINADRRPCLEWDSNPRSQCLSERRDFMPWASRQLWSAWRILVPVKCDVVVSWSVNWKGGVFYLLQVALSAFDSRKWGESLNLIQEGRFIVQFSSE
jgi:hypothetical protein